MTILLFSILAAAATVIGGAIPLLNKSLNEKHLTVLVAFSGGVLLSTGLNHMVVESISASGKWAMLAVSTGFVVLYGYEKMAMIHACREHDCEIHSFGSAALVGIGFHSFLDGFAIAVSFEFEKALGLIVIAAVILHRLPTGISISAIMLSHNYKEKKAWVTLSIIAALAIIGAACGSWIPIHKYNIISMAVGLSGGTFLYIATSDLLPMAHKNNQDYRVPLSFLIGFIAILAISFLNFK